ncbi:hypothetical protein B0H14DRAFT_2598556 [Mycena olivaceomarginata]|nr:hypothetical protein B0H14DRAFT_2625798 [Mycena olivaceomarginata]KAJ7822525.1 hypothetical protein B0H14DRAFT_2598556 [Mycena olivaceomarginata]
MALAAWICCMQLEATSRAALSKENIRYSVVGQNGLVAAKEPGSCGAKDRIAVVKDKSCAKKSRHERVGGLNRRRREAEERDVRRKKPAQMASAIPSFALS